jgi:hypothetical protein
MIFRLVPGLDPGFFELAIAFLGASLFGALTLGWIRNAIRLRGVIVAIGPFGILDRRISDTPVPWSAITKVSMKYHPGSRHLLFDVDPNFEATWPTYFDARLLKVVNRPFGWNGYRISAMDLKAGLGDLENAVMKHRFFDRWGEHSGQNA